MKLTLSKRATGVKRHVVLMADAKEAKDIHMIIYNQVLNREVVPRREYLRNGSVKYRLAFKYLDDLMMTFPHAECSAGIISRMSAEAADALAAMEVPELDIDGFNGELYDFQKIGVERMLRRRRFLLNDEMGLGKTVQLLAAIVGRKEPNVLVVVPNGIKFNWERMTHTFTDCTVSVVDGTPGQRDDALSTGDDITVINCEGLRVRKYKDDDVCMDDCYGGVLHNHDWYEFKNPGVFFEDDTRLVRDIDLPHQQWRDWRIIALDEYHRFKNWDSQMTVGLHMLKAYVKYAMSGTPLLNGRPEELWAILHWMWPKRYPSIEQFYLDHTIKKGSLVLGYKNLKHLRSFFHARSLRRRKEHVHDQLPDVIYVDDYVDLLPEQRRLYDEIENDLRIWVNESPRKIISTLAQMTRLKQACFSPELYDGSAKSAKLDRLKELVKELVASGEKAIIFSQWSKATRIIERELEQYNPAYIDGSVPARARMAQVDKFNEDEDCKVFIGTIGACKEGFTLGAATYVIHCDEGWVPAEKMQATARSAAGGLRGIGTDGNVHVITIRANNTIEEHIDALLARKQSMNDRMVESDAGAKVERITMTDIKELLR